MFASYRIGFEHKRVNHRFGGEGWLGFNFFQPRQRLPSD